MDQADPTALPDENIAVRSTTPRSALRRRAAFVLKVLITAAMFAIVFQAVDFAIVVDRMRSATRLLVGAAALLILVQFLAGAWRWWQVVAVIDRPVSATRVVNWFWTAQFFNQVLPSSVGGDVVRVWFHHKEGASLVKAGLSVLIDRIAGLTGLALTVLAAILVGHAIGFGAGGPGWPAVVILAPAIALVLLAWLARQFRHSGGAIARMVHELARALSGLGRQPRLIAIILLLSLLIHALSLGAFHLLLRALGEDIAWLTLLGTVPIALLAAAVPVSIGGWGVREATLVGLLGLHGVPADSALAASLLFGGLLAMVGLPGGLFLLRTPLTSRSR